MNAAGRGQVEKLPHWASHATLPPAWTSGGVGRCWPAHAWSRSPVAAEAAMRSWAARDEAVRRRPHPRPRLRPALWLDADPAAAHLASRRDDLGRARRPPARADQADRDPR